MEFAIYRYSYNEIYKKQLYRQKNGRYGDRDEADKIKSFPDQTDYDDYHPSDGGNRYGMLCS